MNYHESRGTRQVHSNTNQDNLKKELKTPLTRQGHFLDMPLSPLYHVSKHDWHPIIDLQHRANITGGVIGECWHMLHLNAVYDAALSKFTYACQYGGGTILTYS